MPDTPPREDRRQRSAVRIRGEFVLVVICIGIIAAGPLAVEGAKWWVIGWTALTNMASYIKGRLEPMLDQPPTKAKPMPVEMMNKQENPGIVKEVKTEDGDGSEVSTGPDIGAEGRE